MTAAPLDPQALQAAAKASYEQTYGAGTWDDPHFKLKDHELYKIEAARRAYEAHKAAPCTCHPDDNPPRPCPQKYAYSDCVKAAGAAQPFPSMGDFRGTAPPWPIPPKHSEAQPSPSHEETARTWLNLNDLLNCDTPKLLPCCVDCPCHQNIVSLARALAEAERAGIERAAKVANEMRDGWVKGEATTIYGQAYQCACDQIATAIRALPTEGA